MRQSARPYGKMGDYQDISTAPLYWFGHGLSYTSFKFSEARLSSVKINKNQKLTVEVSVTNTGTVKGKEAVLWYITDPAASISRPMKELKYFEKKEINPGESVVYQFVIDPMRDLSFSDATGKRLLEAGDFYVWVNNQKIKFELINSEK
jgi:beta-glucosidase